MANLANYFSKENLKWLKIIGYYQIIGGTIGVLGMIWLFIQNTTILIGVLATVGVNINAISIYAGVCILKHFNLKPTYYVQGIQVLNFIGLGITYEVVLGSALGFGFEWIDSAKFVLNFQLFSGFNFLYDPDVSDSIRVVVNFIPIIIINYLMKCTEKAAEKRCLLKLAKLENSLFLPIVIKIIKSCFQATNL